MNEGARHRLAFDAYVHLDGTRSIERLHAELSANPELLEGHGVPVLRTLYRWSTAFEWQRRCAEIEREARQRQREAHIEGLSQMYERQAKEGQVLQQEGLRWLQTIDPKRVSASAVTRAIVEGAKLERVALGEPGDLTAEVDETAALARLEQLSDEQLERLTDLGGASPQGPAEPAPD